MLNVRAVLLTPKAIDAYDRLMRRFAPLAPRPGRPSAANRDIVFTHLIEHVDIDRLVEQFKERSGDH